MVPRSKFQNIRVSLRPVLLRLRPYWPVAAVVAAFGLLGVVLTLSSNAATYSKAIEAESGTLSGNQSAGTAAGASANAAVAFGSSAPAGGNSGGPSGGDGPADPSDCANTAAAKYGWGEPQYQSNFNTPALDPTWHPYGPEPGHNAKGTRTPAQISMGGGNVTLNSDGQGTTAAMKWFPGQKYGRWEVCMKVKTGQQHYVLITWPDAEDYPVGGELDFAEETGGPNEQTFFLHCPTSGGGNCAVGSKSNDARQWTAYAMEWTPGGIVGYINGQEFFRNSDSNLSPPRPMNLCIQLDWFERPSDPDAMIVDWARQWPVGASQPSTLGLKPGDPATGRPGTFPDRVPRPMSIQEMRP